MKPEHGIDISGKDFFLSRTILLAAANLIMPFISKSWALWIKENPDQYIFLVSAAMILLRILTKDKLKWLK